MKRSSLWLTVALLSESASARGQLENEALICREDDVRQSDSSHLRSLTLDLMGRSPTMEEYAALESGGVDDAMIDAMLASEAFIGRAVRHHRALLWNNVSNVVLLNFQTVFGRAPSGALWRRFPAIRYRGDDIPCADAPATFDADGQVEFVVGADGLRREGWVEVHPYWAPETTEKVCAFDAQATKVTARGIDCTTSEGFGDPACGCGENLERCAAIGGASEVQRAFATDVELRIASVIRNGEPYTNLFNSRRAFANGPLVHYFRHQTGVPAGARMTPPPIEPERLPDLEYARDQERWIEYQLSPEHAGILTSPAYLLRFQTNRARANRFFDAFLCQPFSPPAGGLPAVDPSAMPHPDLQQRDGCKYCHALLEPAAAHWGRWTERGGGFLAPETFPATREDCRACGLTGAPCSRDCRLYYSISAFSPAERPYVGELRAISSCGPSIGRTSRPAHGIWSSTPSSTIGSRVASREEHWSSSSDVRSTKRRRRGSARSRGPSWHRATTTRRWSRLR